MKITEEWLKEQGWEISHYDIEFRVEIFHYATKMFGKDKVFWNDAHELKIFRDYEEPCDVYADVLIDNVDSVEKLQKSLILCEVCTFKECTDLYKRLQDNVSKIKFSEDIMEQFTEQDMTNEEFIDKACDWIRERNRHACKEWLDKECKDFRRDMMKEESK